MGVATSQASNSLGPENPTKKFVNFVELLGQILSQNNVFWIFRAEPPPSP